VRENKQPRKTSISKVNNQADHHKLHNTKPELTMSKSTPKLSIIGLLVALTYPALAAGFNIPVKAEQTEPAIVNSKNISVIKQSPKTFESFELKDPETGEKITEDKVLTLPDGRQVKAGEFYSELNRVEQDLSVQGYSLRDNVETRAIQDLTGRDTSRFAAQIQKQEQIIKNIDPGVTNQIRQKFDRSSIQQELLQHEQLEQQLVLAAGHISVKSSQEGA
jgi:hypothetical protein